MKLKKRATIFFLIEEKRYKKEIKLKNIEKKNYYLEVYT